MAPALSFARRDSGRMSPQSLEQELVSTLPADILSRPSLLRRLREKRRIALPGFTLLQPILYAEAQVYCEPNLYGDEWT